MKSNDIFNPNAHKIKAAHHPVESLMHRNFNRTTLLRSLTHDKDMSNSLNSAKQHENSVKNASHAESVGNILDNVENVPFALRGSQVKTILYFLFSFIAAAELTAALTFYTASMGLSIIVAAVFMGVLAFLFHGLLHGILSDTAKGIVFGKRSESGAMSNEVNVNIVVSIALLAIASCTVFFIGKSGFSAYRSTTYEKKQDEANKDKPKELGITAEMLTNKKGKISGDKLEQLAAVTTATAKATDSKAAVVTADRAAYDVTTKTITDIVGASAFIIELLLALLAIAIATAKKAAVMDEIARRNGASQPTSEQAQQAVTTTAQAASNTANNTPSVPATNTAQAASQQAAQTATATEPKSEKTGVTKRFNEYDIRDQDLITEHLKKDLERDMFYFSIEQIKAYLSRVNGLVTIISDATTVNIRLHSPVLTDEILTATTQAPTTSRNDISLQDTPPRSPMPFSDNKSGNDGRVIIKGFQRKNEEKQVVTTSRNDISLPMEQDEPTTTKKIIECPTCGTKFEKKNYKHTFCSDECRGIAWTDKTGKKFKKAVKA